MLAAMFLLTNISVLADGNNPESSADVFAQQLGFCDFDINNNIDGNPSVFYQNDEHKNVAEVPSSGSVGFNFGKKIKSGKFVMSFDLFFKENVDLYLRTYSETNRGGTAFENFLVKKAGYIYESILNSSSIGASPKREYKANAWYGIDIWYDFDERKIKTYIDGSFFAQTPMKDDLTEVASFALLPIGTGTVVDNVGALYIPTNGVVDMKNYPFVHYYDNEYDNAVQPWIETGKIGNAFFGESLDFKLKLVNNQNVPHKGMATIKYINADGVSTTEQKPFELAEYGNTSIDFDIKTECFGYSELDAIITDESENVIGTSSKEISVVAEGKTNYKIGLNDHISRPYRGYDQFELFKKMGAGVYREGIDPSSIFLNGSRNNISNTVSGKQLEKFIKLAEDNPDIKFLITLHLGGTGCGWDDKIPIGQEQINLWLEYVKYAISLTKNIKNVDFEIGNEFNYTTKANPEKYNSKQYFEVCKAAYPVIKGERPDARIFGCSSGSTDNTETYLTELMQCRVGDYLDGFSIHPYDVYHGPEYQETRDRIDGLHKIFEDYGYGDKPVIYSEYGWTTAVSTGVDDYEKARWVPQSAVLLTDYAENNEYYNLMKKGKAFTDFEDNFGFVEHMCSEVPFKPTMTYMAMSNYNRLMTGTGGLEEFNFANGDATVCTVENESGGKSVMAWAKEEKNDVNISLKLGTDSVMIYDLFGNMTKVKTINGILPVTLGQDPIYIIGNIHSVSEEVSDTYINERKLDIVENDISYITGKLSDKSYDVEFVCPDNINAEKAEVNDDGTFKAKLQIGDNAQKFGKIRVNIKKGDEVIYCTSVDLNYVSSIQVTPSIIYYKNSYWRLKIKVTNKSNSMNLSGKVVLTEPSDFEIPSNQAEFRDIAPNGSKYIYINISPQYTKKKFTAKGYVETTYGEKVEFSETSYFVGLMYLSKEPTIDGKIEDGEYNTLAPIKLNTKDYTINRLANYPGFDETSGTIYLNYDERNLYLAAKIYDSVEGATGDASRVWQNDSIQLALAEVADVNAARTEYCIGKDNKGVPTITRYAFIGTKTVAGGGAGDAVEMGENIKLEIGRDGMYTIYEFRIPWTEVFGEERPVLDRRNLLFSALINDNDGLGRTGYVEFCPGIGGTKNPAEFSKIQALK